MDLKKRIEKLELRWLPAGAVPVIQGLDADGKVLYLNTTTGELSAKLPRGGVVVQKVAVDLTGI